ncbi:RHOMBOID-like protein 9, chloroplastic isoform X1 [Neltuma alba]|uniref:RHOMBOID-like protein 9, chloroplastic isoform X1 n=2 Tax=Neltuma alba TaxID=207710 RepID=UPI0010A2DFD9|nr:RHOMBOID-like protein 9, chloroplastic isoform X1 [Prosopis alba]
MTMYMAAFLLGYKAVYNDQNLPIQSISRKNDRRLVYDPMNMQRSFSSTSGQICKRTHPSYADSDHFPKSNLQEGFAPRCLGQAGGCSLHNLKTKVTCLQRVCGSHSHIKLIHGCYSKRNKFSLVRCSAESGGNEKQLRSLDSYFGKLQDNPTLLSPSDSSDQVIRENNEKSQAISTNGLESLNAFLGKLNNGASQESSVPSTYIELHKEEDISKKTKRYYAGKQKTYLNIRRTKGERDGRSYRDTIQQDEASNLYLIGILASINIAVFLFEIASPIRNSDLELFSIPLLYGAKINHLIVVGEWWRLVTPMFLHSGIFHMALSCWALVSFGPHVCRGYGSFTFLLIYILGGVSGNLTSFLHTPDPTVGGTGPVFAIIGAWLAYQIQNKDIDDKDTSETMFQKAIVFTAASFILSHFCPIDDWSHFGSAITGMAYGFFTSPRFELKDASSSSGRGGQEEGLKLVRQYGDSCRSAFVFTIFVIALSSFLFFMEPPLNALASVDEVIEDYLLLYMSENSLS